MIKLPKYEEFISENRIKSKEVTYTENSKKIVAAFSGKGKKSKDAQTIISQYIELDEQIKALSVQHSGLKNDIKEFADEVFDATDVLMTRVVEVSDFTVTLTAEGESEKVNYEKVLSELVKLNPKLIKKVEELLAMYTETKKVASRLHSAKQKIKEQELTEGFADIIKDWYKKIKDWYKEWKNFFKLLDSEIVRIKSLM